MANALRALADGAVSCADGKIKLDRDKAAALSNRLGKISADIEMSAAQIEGPVSETQPLWTGKAAEDFFRELTALVAETKEIAEKVSGNRQSLENAVKIIMAAENKIDRDVDDLSAGGVFKNI